MKKNLVKILLNFYKNINLINTSFCPGVWVGRLAASLCDIDHKLPSLLNRVRQYTFRCNVLAFAFQRVAILIQDNIFDEKVTENNRIEMVRCKKFYNNKNSIIIV